MPWQFEQLQPHEFYLLLDGYKWRQEQQENMQAYWVANVMAPHLKKAVTPKELLKPFRREKQKQKSNNAQYLREQFKDIHL